MHPYLRPAALHVGPEADDLLGAGRATSMLGGALACSLAERIEWTPGQARRSAWVDATEVDWPAAFTTARPTPFDLSLIHI